MNKRKVVREWLLNQDVERSFGIKTLAEILKVKPKDVSNVITILVTNGALEKSLISKGSKGSKEFNYTIIDTTKLKSSFSKLKIRTIKLAPNPPNHKTLIKSPLDVSKIVSIPVKYKRRSKLVIAIDTEIVILQAKITKLQNMRKEFI